MLELLIALSCGAAVGLSLGLTGGGGSLFALPLLIYVLGVPIAQAVPASLLVVGITALIGCIDALRLKLVFIRPTLIFAISGMASAPLGLWAGDQLNDTWRLGLFAMLAALMGLRMWFKPADNEIHTVRARLQPSDESGPICRYAPDGQLNFSAPCALFLFLGGCLTGLLSGLFGVGGGFIIVPILMATIKLPIARAVGSSLVIITLISASGALSAAPSLALQQSVLIPFIVGGVLGMISGRITAARITGKSLQNIFAAGLLLVALGMLIQLF